MRHCRAVSGNDYMVGCPDLVEGLDILATRREPQTLLMDMLERPEWVEEKLAEIAVVWREVYARIYDIIKLGDGGAAYWAFYLWGPGKTAKVQCDMSAMFSPEMFERFVVPGLTAHCEWLDCSLYHLDGTQALGHRDQLLGVEALDAIEWTPQAGIETGGSPRWYDLYRRILAAGKSVQVMDVLPGEIIRSSTPSEAGAFTFPQNSAARARRRRWPRGSPPTGKSGCVPVCQPSFSTGIIPGTTSRTPTVP